MEMGLLRDGSLAACDVVLCEWPRYEHRCRMRSERSLGSRLNPTPVADDLVPDERRKHE
jgi:hypothetical protein